MSKVTCRECRREVPRLAHRDRGICKTCWRAWRKTSTYVPGRSLSGRIKASPCERVLTNIAIGETGCWLWTGSLNAGGYGCAYDAFRKRGTTAHRLSYEAFVGPVPEGLNLDHTCHNRDLTCSGGSTCLHRRCVNPEHLEPVTQRENIMRSSVSVAAINAAKTHCPQGHPYDEANTYHDRGGRLCATCQKSRALARYYARKVST